MLPFYILKQVFSLNICVHPNARHCRFKVEGSKCQDRPRLPALQQRWYFQKVASFGVGDFYFLGKTEAVSPIRRIA